MYWRKLILMLELESNTKLHQRCFRNGTEYSTIRQKVDKSERWLLKKFGVLCCFSKRKYLKCLKDNI